MKRSQTASRHSNQVCLFSEDVYHNISEQVSDLLILYLSFRKFAESALGFARWEQHDDILPNGLPKWGKNAKNEHRTLS